MRVVILASALLCVLLAGCGRSPEGGAGQARMIASDDAAMNAAEAHARDTLDEFLTHFLEPGTSEQAFSVKKPVEGNGTVEHFWLVDLQYHEGVFTGYIGNEPEHVDTVTYGEEVTVAASEISDWMYMDGTRMVGNFTFRVIVDRLPPDEAAQIREQFQL